MPIPFSGQFTTPATPEQAYDFLSDPNKFGPLLPDFQSMIQEDSTHFTVRLKVSVATFSGTTDIRMELREAERPRHLLYLGRGSAFGNEINVQIGFDMFPAPQSTLVAWRGRAEVVGKMAMMAGTMLEPLAGKGMARLMDGLKKTLAQQAAPAIVVHEEPGAEEPRAAPGPSPALPAPDTSASAAIGNVDPSTSESDAEGRQN